MVMVLTLLIIAVGLLVLSINKPKDVEIYNYVGKDGKNGQSIIGPQGLIGPSGESIVGPAGKDGGTTVNNITTNIPVVGPVGEASPKLFVSVDINCLLKSRYEGDDLWQVLAQLPKPCEVGNEQ
jgi:hypothetical protein